MQIKKLVSMYSRTGRDLQRYNFEGCRQVVGCITYRFKKNHKAPSVHGTLINELEFLLISSQKSSRMMFPKGGWELDETIEDAANRETMEEAGVLGIVGNKLGVWTFKSKSQDTFHEGHMLSFKVTEELDCWPEKDVRTRVWLSAEEARKICGHEWMKEALDRFILQLDEDEDEKAGTPTLLDLLRLDESSCGRLSLSEEEEEVSCALTHFQRKEEEVSCALTHFQRKEEEVSCALTRFQRKEEEVSCSLTHFQRKEEECRIHLFTMHLPRSPCSTEKSRISRVSQAGEEDVALLVN